MAIYKNEAVTETMFSPCPKYRPQLISATLLKTESLGAHFDCGENRIAAGMLDRVKAWKSQWGRVTHTHKIRLGLGNLLIPISAPVWSVRAPALQGLSNTEPVHPLLQTLRADVVLWKYSALDFDVFQLRLIIPNRYFFTGWNQSQTWVESLWSKLSSA